MEACDGSRLRVVERRDGAPIVQTADATQIIKAKIDAYREEKLSGGSSPPFFPGHGDGNIKPGRSDAPPLPAAINTRLSTLTSRISANGCTDPPEKIVQTA